MLKVGLVIASIWISFLTPFPVENSNSHLACLNASCGDIRITDLEIIDNGSGDGTGNFAIDSIQDQCGDPPDTEDEPFSDTFIRLTIINNTNFRFNARWIRFALYDTGTGNRELVTAKISPSAGLTVDADGEPHQVLAFVADVDGATKRFAGSTELLSAYTGFKNLRATLGGRANGNLVRLRASTTVSIDNYDRCDN
jgi:hypothetical protein